MRLLLVATALALTGCGASSTGSLGQVAPSNAPHDNREAPAPSVPPSAASSPTSTAPRPSATTLPVVTATVGTGTTGPGRRSSPAASPSARPTPSPVAGTVTVTDADNGATVRLAPGQHLRVRLSTGTWDPPTSSADGVVVRRTSRGGYPTGQPVDATFEAIGQGTADVGAQSDAACFHTQPRCMMAQREWRVTVAVR